MQLRQFITIAILLAFAVLGEKAGTAQSTISAYHSFQLSAEVEQDREASHSF